MTVIRVAGAVVLPAPRGEGFGRVLAEAMLLERPVITSNIGGALDFVVGGQTGLLVAPRDAVSLADAIERLSQETMLAATLGKKGRAFVRSRFSIERIAATWESYFEKLLKEKRGAARSAQTL